MRAIYLGVALVAAGSVALFMARLIGLTKREHDEPTLTEWKRIAYGDAPADAEQRLRDAIGRSGR